MICEGRVAVAEYCFCEEAILAVLPLPVRADAGAGVC